MYKDNNNKAIYGESFIYQKLIENGIDVKWVSLSSRMSKADFITHDGKTIDVKYSNTSHKGRKSKPTYREWRFNVHHHGKKQTGIDFYICVLKNDDEHVIVHPFWEERSGYPRLQAKALAISS